MDKNTYIDFETFKTQIEKNPEWMITPNEINKFWEITRKMTITRINDLDRLHSLSIKYHLFDSSLFKKWCYKHPSFIKAHITVHEAFEAADRDEKRKYNRRKKFIKWFLVALISVESLLLIYLLI